MSIDPTVVQELFLRLIELPPADRSAALERETGSDAELQQRVAALLQAHNEPDSYLDQSPEGLEAKLISQSEEARSAVTGEHTPSADGSQEPQAAQATGIEHRPALAAGVVIAGRYELQEMIGEGGMGEVWVARQTEPIKRRVAVKLIKTGMDSRAVLARFEQERQALGVMEHPHIARILDGGLTPSGQPFFVMELVNGLPLMEFCDKATLKPHERLELFVPICQAVQHAHQKGIVHRDLKPANILVTLIDGRPIPKVIDFGVAKAIGGKLTDESLSTQFGAIVGTLEYMSPEQAGFSGVDIDTRADIYSLGVMLYELLTGLRPIDAARLKKAGFAEMIHIIQKEEPSKPSTRLSSGDALPSMAAVRGIEPNRLVALLRGELDWIVMKCLEKQRDRRYETANALVREIQRYLANEPVEARPQSAGYRIQKFVRRHKGLVLGASLVALALVVGVLGTTSGMIRAWNAESETAQALDELTVEQQRTQDAFFQMKAAQQTTATALAAEKQSKLAAVAAEMAALRQAATSTFEKALQICEQGNAPQGLLWLAKSLDLAERADEALLVEAIRHNLAAWSTECHELTAILQLGSDVTDVAFSPDDQTVFGVGTDGGVLAWNAATGVRLPLRLPHPAPVSSLIVDPSGEELYTLCQDGVVRRWAIPAGQLEASTENLYEDRPDRQLPFAHDRLLYRGLALHPKGDVVAVATTAGIQLRDSQSLEVVGDPFPNEGVCYHLIFDASGEHLWAAYADVQPMFFPRNPFPRMLCWRVSDRSMVGRPLNIGIPFSLAAHPLKLEAAVGCWQGNFVMRSNTQGESQPRQTHFGIVGAVAYDPTGRFLAAGGHDHAIRFWAAEGSHPYAPTIQLPSRLTAVAFARQNGILAAGRQGGFIRLYRTPQPLSSQVRVGGWQMGLDIHPQGNRLISCNFNNKVFLSDDQLNPLPTRMPEGLTGQYSDCGFAIGGRIAYLGWTDPRLLVWDPGTGKVEFTTPVPAGAGRLAIDGRGLLGLVGGGFVGGSTGQACCVDLVTGEILSLLPQSGDTRYVALSEDGSLAATANSDGDVQLWQPRTGQRIGSPRPHTATVTAIALSPCNLYAATGTDTGVLRLWSLPDWRQVGKPMSYGAEVSAVTFSTDSKLLAAAARDGVLRLWHAATQTPIGSKVSHGDAVSSVKFAPDGASFYTASRDYHLRRVQLCLPWQGDAKAVLRRAELVAGLGFDTDEAIAPLTEEQHWERAGSTPYAQWSATANLAIPRKVDAADVFRLEIEALRAELARRTKDAEPPDEGATQAYRSQLAESEAKFYHVVRDYRARDDVLQHHPEAAIAMGHLLLADQAWEPAIALYTRLITDDEANATLLSQRGVAHLGAEQWDLGQADWLRAVGEEPALARDAFHEFKQVNRWNEAALFGLLLMEQDPQNSLLWLEVAPSVVLSEDEEAYGKFCRRVVELAGQNPSPRAAERAIKACLLRAGAIDLAALPGDRLARSLDEETPEKRLLPWFWGARALLALRSGDAESAKNFLTQPEAYHGNDLGRAMNLAILALAQHELKHSGEARKTLDEASQLITRLKEIQSNQGNQDLLITEILLREAESTIN